MRNAPPSDAVRSAGDGPATPRPRMHLFFAERSAEVRPGSRARLDAIARAMRADPGLAVALRAHANSEGSDAIAARDLAVARVLAVRAALLDAGAPPGQIRDVPSLALHLAHRGASPLERAICRRVDVLPAPDEVEPALPRRAARGSGRAATAAAHGHSRRAAATAASKVVGARRGA